MAWLSANIAAVAATSSAHSSGQMSSGKAMMTMSNGSMMPMSGKGGMSMSMSGAMPTGSAAAAMGKTGSATKHGVSEESWRLGMLLVGVGAGALLEL